MTRVVATGGSGKAGLAVGELADPGHTWRDALVAHAGSSHRDVERG